MVTIKDIAKKAGVAQGTVSNVLNGKGNVSSKKIKQVMEAASLLGYVPNERAKLLRKGHSNILAALLPNLHSKQYIDFYLSFKSYAESHGFTSALYLTNDDQPEAEANAIQEINSSMAIGIAAISSTSKNNSNPYKSALQSSANHVVFVERKPDFPCNYIGFDYKKAGISLALKSIEAHYTKVCLLTGDIILPHEADFYNGFMETIVSAPCSVQHIQTDSHRKYQSIMHFFNKFTPEVIFTSSYDFAKSVKDICSTFYADHHPSIYTISPLFTMPETDFEKYELNYHNLGKVTAEKLIQHIKGDTEDFEFLLESEGFRDWYINILPTHKKRTLNILTLDTPSAYTMKNLSRIYTQKTGIPVNITIYSYDEIYESFNNMNDECHFDILRLDVTWLSWYAEKLLRPLDEIDPSISDTLHRYLDGTIDKYSIINGKVYALPSSPSIQLLFYRKDLFESTIYRRMYFEQYKRELAPPTTFEEFNTLAKFFSKAYHPHSPVDYGATMTLGSTGVAGSEFLSRLFSLQDHLYDAKGQIVLNSPNALKALELLVELKAYSNPIYNTWWTNTATSFAEGNVAMTILYSNYASNLLMPSSKVIGNIGYTMVPGGNAVVGGGCLGVSKYSSAPEEALSFIKWMCSEPISSAATLLGSVSPCKKTYANYEIINTFPWLNTAKDCFALSKGKRTPSHIHQPFNERHFLSIIGMAVKNAYSGIVSPKEALDEAQKLYEKHFNI